MTENQIQEDIETLEEMLPIEEAWIERQQITKRTDPDRMFEFTKRQGRYYRAWEDLRKLRELREAKQSKKEEEGQGGREREEAAKGRGGALRREIRGE